MTTQRIHLIRHGQTDWNRAKRVQGQSESILTDEGRHQAASLRPALSEYGIGHVYCSSSVRTRQTAEILFADSSVHTEYCDQLREIYLGPWETRYQTEIRETSPDQFEYFWHKPHLFSLQDAETFEQAQQRGMARFTGIMEECEARDIALVSHGVLIKTILCYLENRPLSRLWEPPVMHNCAHSIVEFSASQAPRIIQYAGVPA